MTDAAGGCSPAEVDELGEPLGQAGDAAKLDKFGEAVR